MITFILLFLLTISILLLINTIFSFFLDTKDSLVKNHRLKQLGKNNPLNFKNIDIYDVFNSISESGDKRIVPILKKIFPSISTKDEKRLQSDLNLVNWKIDAKKYISLVWTLRYFGIILIPFSFLFGDYFFFILAVSILLIFGIEFWFKNDLKQKKEQIFAEFPGFIRVVSGYLSADITLNNSIRPALRYVGDGWRKILEEFLADCEGKTVLEALENMNYSVNVFEVSDFVENLKLVIEQGGDAKHGFLSQAEKIEEMQKHLAILQISKRKGYVQILQFPILVIIMALIGIPVIYNIFGLMSSLS